MSKSHSAPSPTILTGGHVAWLPNTLLHAALGAIVRPFTVLMVWQQRLKERQALAEMEQFRLDDMGISRAAALREASKPIWKR